MGVDSVTVEGYEHFERIGSGGFSTVFRAEQINLGRDVAIKVLDARFSNPSDLRTFERECRVLGRLSRHPHIVTVYSDAVADDGRRCIVMELYEDTARQRLDRDGPSSVVDVLRLGVKIGGALHAAHGADILHRDMKPHNILYSDYDEPALADFGISTIADEKSITAASAVSVAYASPELLDDQPASVASDVYAFGATLHHLLTGSPPFVSAHLPATISRTINEPPPVIDRPDVPVSLSRLLAHCLAKDPVDRPVDVAAVIDELRGIQVELELEPTGLASLRRSEVADVASAAEEPGAGVPHSARTGDDPVAASADGGAPRDTPSAGSFWPNDWRPDDVGAEDTIARPNRVVSSDPAATVVVTKGAGAVRVALVVLVGAALVGVGMFVIFR